MQRKLTQVLDGKKNLMQKADQLYTSIQSHYSDTQHKMNVPANDIGRSRKDFKDNTFYVARQCYKLIKMNPFTLDTAEEIYKNLCGEKFDTIFTQEEKQDHESDAENVIDNINETAYSVEVIRIAPEFYEEVLSFQNNLRDFHRDVTALKVTPEMIRMLFTLQTEHLIYTLGMKSSALSNIFSAASNSNTKEEAKNISPQELIRLHDDFYRSLAANSRHYLSNKNNKFTAVTERNTAGEYQTIKNYLNKLPGKNYINDFIHLFLATEREKEDALSHKIRSAYDENRYSLWTRQHVLHNENFSAVLNQIKSRGIG